MRTVSVKLSDATRARVEAQAASHGTSAHAFMVEAIEAHLHGQEKQDAFIQEALAARTQMIESGKAFDGDEVLGYLRAKARGERPARPRAKSLRNLVKPGR